MNGATLDDDNLLDPALLEGLSEEQRQEALAAAAAAKRAEERAEQRALERAMKQREKERQQEQAPQTQTTRTGGGSSIASGNGARVVFVPKRKRQRVASQQTNPTETTTTTTRSEVASARIASAASSATKNHAVASRGRKVGPTGTIRQQHSDNGLSKGEQDAIKEAYLGKSVEEKEQEQAQKRKKQRTTKKITFKFRWDDTDDTFQDSDPLYASMLPSNASSTTRRKKTSARIMGETEGTGASTTRVDRLLTKPLDQMTTRDWRILRENYEIIVKGGRAPPPLRSFRESPDPSLPPIHPSLLDAIENVLGFREPSPIQRQACTVGLQRRDLIGLAETGSGKTIAFGLPLCHYLLNLPPQVLQSVADDGPLALVMAPTRELALQIDVELTKLLSRQGRIQTCAIVGGQAIQQQAQAVRKGVHIIVGTPGRINDCIEMAYLVLNQCCYVVLDEADRMVDMGFLPQVESILDNMGGKMKSELEAEVYQQEKEDLQKGDLASYRITAMFSATMPLEVERIAKRYLRHPAIVSIGDRESGKNTRIVQKLVWLASPVQKEKALRDQITNPRFYNEKIIVFVNEKKHADQVGRIVERAGRQCVVLHGGKSQELREESLETFRRGGVVMVATDVAGRGLDIPDVAHVINYDLPTRSIESYTHRIGRTGRAGKEGLATSFITDEDEGIMAALKKALESTGSAVPDRLARHPAASSNTERNLIY